MASANAQQVRQDMPINLKPPQLKELKPRIVVCGVGGAGGNAINNMIASGLTGVDFVVANTDAQALGSSRAQRVIQMGLQLTEGLGAGAKTRSGPGRCLGRCAMRPGDLVALLSPVSP